MRAWRESTTGTLTKLTIDYELSRISWRDITGQKLYENFDKDESGERARLTIQY